MLGVYNYMTLGLGVTGLVAFFAYKAAVVESATGHIVGLTGFGQAIYRSPLRWVIIFAPLLVVFGLSGRHRPDVGERRARLTFLAFAALMGLSMSIDVPRSTRRPRSRSCSSRRPPPSAL